MVQELSYNVISLVIDSWEQVRRIKNYEEVAGAVLFQRYVNFGRMATRFLDLQQTLTFLSVVR
jgi:hypothetical protein